MVFVEIGNSSTKRMIALFCVIAFGNLDLGLGHTATTNHDRNTIHNENNNTEEKTSFECLLDALASNYGQNKLNNQKPQSHFKYFQQITMGATNRQHNQYTMSRIDCRFARNERNSAFPFNMIFEFRFSILIVAVVLLYCSL